MRKTVIALSAAVFVGAVFLVYMKMTRSGAAIAPNASQVQDLPLQASDIMPKEVGETIIKIAHQSRYTVLNPQTKALSRVLGFATLLNPGTESNRWQVEEPYIELHEPSYLCRITSDKGTFTIDSSSGGSSPSDAQLSENVVIHIQPRTKGKVSETFIYLDDLFFSSERSEFSTDGPVKMVSDNTLLEGSGMIMVFNSAVGRIDYLNIRDLKQLVIKDTAMPQQSEEKAVAQQAGQSPVNETTASADTTAQPKTESPDLYQCVLKKNVLIRYGKELVIAGADNVAIQNIKYAASKDSSSDVQEQTAHESQVQTDVNPENQVTQAGSNPQVPVTASDKDIIVTCDGGIIVEPMPKETASSLLNVHMTGAPLKIERFASAGSQQKDETIVNCGSLEYTPQEDILRLFTNSQQKQITLNEKQSNRQIETSGNVIWNQKAGLANIKGPGKVYLPSDLNEDQSEITFGGAMDLLFAQGSSQAALKKINLTGGMDAILKKEGWYKTSAQSAELEFGPANSLSQAVLDGNVKLESLQAENPQRASSQAAVFKFGPQNAISTAQMTGNVFFESGQKEKSHAQAQQAVFYFDNSKIRSADLEGGVRFASDAGQLTSSDAKIDFSLDSSGVMKPVKVRTAGNTVLLAAVAAEDQPPAKFEAAKIDYDLQTRAGLAHGPVKFTFYQKAEESGSSIEPWLPVTVTADGDTQFLSNQAGQMEQVIFNKNVLASRLVKSFNYTETDQFHGDVLTVYLGAAEDGRMGISEIYMTQGNVFAESIRSQNDNKLSHIRLTCKDVRWNRIENILLAKGPGQIELDNSNAATVDSTGQVKSFYQRPGFARVTGFDSLLWNMQAQTLVADGKADTMQMAYVPLVDGKPEKFLYANSMRFDLFFTTDSASKVVLKRAFTDQGITFRELNADQSETLNDAAGQSLDYNPIEGNGWLKISGSQAVPCFLNGTRVPSVFANVDTGEVNTSLSTIPSVYTK